MSIVKPIYGIDITRDESLPESNTDGGFMGMRSPNKIVLPEGRWLELITAIEPKSDNPIKWLFDREGLNDTTLRIVGKYAKNIIHRFIDNL